jgi:hypothetical protein
MLAAILIHIPGAIGPLLCLSWAVLDTVLLVTVHMSRCCVVLIFIFVLRTWIGNVVRGVHEIFIPEVDIIHIGVTILFNANIIFLNANVIFLNANIIFLNANVIVFDANIFFLKANVVFIEAHTIFIIAHTVFTNAYSIFIDTFIAHSVFIDLPICPITPIISKQAACR